MRVLALAFLTAGLAAAQKPPSASHAAPSPTHAPTEMLQGPRADDVMPDRLEPGKQYHLQVLGKNFAVGTEIAFGSDVQVIGLPFVASPTTAYVDVLVSLAAVPGVRPATASNRDGSNVGPGGVFIGPVLPEATSTPEASPTPKAKKKRTKKPNPTPAG